MAVFMARLPSATRTRILARITTYELLLEQAQDNLAASTEIKEYRFDSGEGSQRTAFHDPGKLLKNIRSIERILNSLYARLNCTGIANMNLRRKAYY